jgi:hypothetical protein
MRHLVLLLVCLLSALAQAAERYTLARILITGSERYQQDDLMRADRSQRHRESAVHNEHRTITFLQKA